MKENIFISEPLFYYEGKEKSVDVGRNYSDEFVETALLLMNEYVDNNSHLISDPDFCECIEEELTELLISQLEDLLFDDENEEEFESMIEYSIDYFYEHIFPRKSEDTNTFIDRTPIARDAITEQIQRLQLIPQPVQKTEEWYEFRHNLITASNAYKVWESQSAQNQLIYEKCQPLKVVDANSCSGVNVHSTLHWGQKYEPVSAMIYENMYDTKLGDFGCIRHNQYGCIGASPDGINIDTASVRYGRMIEIKNIVNREINGNPKKEYWVQMQLQMEICDLDECDFLETQFIEYENESDFLNDSSGNEDSSAKYTRTKEGCYKGIIMYFADSNGSPIYKYKDVEMGEEWVKWEESQIQEQENNGVTWIKNIYWKLKHYSCVLVKRNKIWFQYNIQEILKFWKIIEHERENGYDHRKPKKRIKPEANSDTQPIQQLIKVNKENNKVECNYEE